MSLTAGATLQNSKYVIQTRLNQTDFGATYQATHSYLNQPVILQTLNSVLRQRHDFAQVQQQFMEGVRSLPKPPEFPRLLDCFVEDGMPFVVLELLPAQPLPKLSDWLTILPEKVDSPEKANRSEAESLEASSPEPKAAEISSSASSSLEEAKAAPSENQPVESSATTFVGTAVSTISAAEVAPLQTASTSATEASPSELKNFESESPTLAANGAAERQSLNSNRERSFQPRAKRWSAVALVIASLIGGGVGAGSGLALRLSSSHHQSGAENSTTSLGSSWFSREQSFPAQQDWPISETPGYSSPAPSAEEPAYRANTPTDYRANTATDYSAPVYSAPEIQPAPKETVAPEPAAPASISKPAPKPIPSLPPLSGIKSQSLAPIQPVRPARTPSVAGYGSELPSLTAPVAPVAPIAPAPTAPDSAASTLPPLAPKQLPTRVPNVVNQ
jgi:hypothetical protein